MRYYGFIPPQALLTTSSFAAQGLHHPDRERDLLERVALVQVKPPFHRHHRQAGQPAADEPAAMADRRCERGKCGISSYSSEASSSNLLGQAAQARAEDDAGMRRPLPGFANERGGGFDFFERPCISRRISVSLVRDRGKQAMTACRFYQCLLFSPARSPGAAKNEVTSTTVFGVPDKHLAIELTPGHKLRRRIIGGGKNPVFGPRQLAELLLIFGA